MVMIWLRRLALYSCRRVVPCPDWHSCLSGCSPLFAPEFCTIQDPGSRLEIPDSRRHIRFKDTDHNVSTTGGTIVLPAKKIFSFQSLFFQRWERETQLFSPFNPVFDFKVRRATHVNSWSLMDNWHLAICSARLAAAGRNVQVRLGQRVGRNLKIKRIWSVLVFHSFYKS